MKKVFSFLFLICLLGIIYINRNKITYYITRNFFSDEKIVFGEPNSYYKDYDYGYVQNTDNLYPNSRQDILNIIYSTLNRGLDEVTFYCDDNYVSCIDDVNDIAGNSLYLSTINNLVHPYNSYSNINFSINNYGKVVISINRIYSESDIDYINNKIKEISNLIIYDDMSDYDKILSFHDYIVNNTVYDSTVSIDNQLENGTNSNNAFGLLSNGKAICSGYSDVMAIFLSMYGFNNYRISSDEHVWNLIYFDGSWRHLDATWDDPVTTNGSNVLLHDFFLVDSEQLFYNESTFEKNNHIFDKDLYIEAN